MVHGGDQRTAMESYLYILCRFRGLNSGLSACIVPVASAFSAESSLPALIYVYFRQDLTVAQDCHRPH